MHYFFVFWLVWKFGQSHQCDHEKIRLEPRHTHYGKFEGGERALEGWRDIRVLVDYSNLNAEFSNDNAHALMIKYVLMNQIVDTLQRNLKVSGRSTIFGLDEDSCQGFAKIPSNATDVIDADLIIFVKAENSPNENYIAQATACTICVDTNRPTTGVISFNFANMGTEPENLDENFRIGIHEVMHILFFSPSLYHYFVGYDYQNLPFIKKNDVYIMKTPKLVDFA